MKSAGSIIKKIIEQNKSGDATVVQAALGGIVGEEEKAIKEDGGV